MTIDEQFQAIDPENYPKHIAIIPNGHRTWAKEHNIDPKEAHRIGMELLVEFARFIRKIGIHTVSVWTMSTENFKLREKDEVDNLGRLFKYAIKTWAEELHEDGTRLIHIGRKDHMSEDLRELVSSWEKKTKDNIEHTVNIAYDYGGHDEILRAMEKAFVDIKAGKISFEDLRAEVGRYHGKYPYMAFKKYLDTKDQPYPFPDLIIRSSGEMRLSGFMPWQSVYSEFHPVHKYMPEFSIEDIKGAIVSYARRTRTFGGDKEEELVDKLEGNSHAL